MTQDNCKDQILKMKSYAALAERDPSQSDDYYSSILAVMEEIGSSDRAAECRAVAEKVIADIEKKLDEKQKREWELEKASMKMKTSCVKKSIRPYKAFIATTHPQPT